MRHEIEALPRTAPAWQPRTTVAVVVEQGGSFLMVEERDGDQLVFNQPAGHLEADETLFEAARRETFEETGWEVKLRHFLGFYYTVTPDNVPYIRYCFIADPLCKHEDTRLDERIHAVHWLEPETIFEPDFPARSPSVLLVMQDFFTGRHYPLDILSHLWEGRSALEPGMEKSADCF